MQETNNFLDKFYKLENFEYLPGDKQTPIVLRTFYPKIKRILSDGLSYTIYQERFGLNDNEIATIKLFVAYYSLNTSYPIEKPNEKISNPLLKYRKKYLESTLYYSKSFNPEYSKLNKELKSPTKKEVNQKTRDIVDSFFEGNKFSDKKVRDAILDNIYLDDLKILQSSKAALDYFRGQLKIAQRLWDKLSLENLSVEEIRNNYESIKTDFSSDNLLDFLRKNNPSLDLIVKKALKILDKCYHSKLENNNAIIVEEVSNLIRDLSIFLSGFRKSKKPHLAEKISFWNNELLKIKSGDQKPIESLQWIIDEFANKDDLRQLLLRISEKYIHIISSTFSKRIFKAMDNKVKLSKAEKRLFIIMNIAIPTFGYRLPLLDKIHENFFRFHPDAFKLTMDNIVLIKKNSKVVKLFQQFLYFYPIWAMLQKEDETEAKYKSIPVPDNEKAKTSTEYKGSMISSSIENDESNISQGETDSSLKEEGDDEKFDFSGVLITNPDIKMKEGSLLRLLKKALNKKEYLYFIQHALKGLSQSDIAKEFKVSQPYVSKVISSAIKKSKKDNRIKLFWES